MMYLFDVDGTLVLTGGAGAKALDRVFLERYGWGCPRGLPFDGKTDPLIVAEILEHRLGRSPAAGEVDDILERYLEYLVDEVARAERYRIMPGVEAALELLAARGATIGLATGNVERGARIKLERGALWHRFAFGGYGSDSSDRARLVARAIERGEAHAGRRFSPKEVFVIGDTPRDIEAAHACGAVAIAVATGPHSIDALRAAGADAALATLHDLPL